MKRRHEWSACITVLIIVSVVANLLPSFLDVNIASAETGTGNPPQIRNQGTNVTGKAGGIVSIEENDTIELRVEAWDQEGLYKAWLSTNEGGAWINYSMFDGYQPPILQFYYENFTDMVAHDFQQLYNRRYNSTTYVTQFPGFGDDYFAHLTSGIRLYLWTGNETYKTIAEKTANDIISLNLINATTNMIGAWNGTDPVSTRYYYTGNTVQDIILLSYFNSSYSSMAEDLLNGLYTYGVNSTTSLPEWVWSLFSNGTTGTTTGGQGQTIMHTGGTFLTGYQITQNETYLDWSREILDALWSCRNTTTNLLHDDYDENGTGISDFLRVTGSTSGRVLSFMIRIYTLTENSTYLEMIENFTNALIKYAWTTDDEGRWVYRVKVDGSDFGDSQGCMHFATLDTSLVLAYQLTGNATYYEYAWNDFNHSYFNPGVLWEEDDGLIRHGTVTNSEENRLTTNIADLNSAIYFYGNDTSLNVTRIQKHIDNLNRFRNDTGYWLIYDKNDEDKIKIDSLYVGPSLFSCFSLAWMYADNLDSWDYDGVTLKPSFGPCETTDYEYVFMFQKFNQTNLLNVTYLSTVGKVNVTINWKSSSWQIYSVYENGSLYSNYLNYTLTTKTGTNTYKVTFDYLGAGSVYGSPINLHGASETWTWCNFTWQNTTITGTTYISWKIYIKDIHGNIISTSLETFCVYTPPLHTYNFHGLYDESTGYLESPSGRAVDVTAYFSSGNTTETFTVNGSYNFLTTLPLLYFRFDLGVYNREYWLSDENATDIYIFNQTLTSYTVQFLDLAGVLNEYPFVELQRYVNGSLMTVEKRKVDVEDKIVASLMMGEKYTIIIKDGSSYTYGDVAMTATTSVSLTLRGIQFPKLTLMTYKYVRIYAYRTFDTPNGSITIYYQDTLNETNSVVIHIKYKNGTEIYNSTETADSFSHVWSNALNNTDYLVECIIDHDRYGVYTWRNYYPRSMSSNPWGLDFLGSLPFNTGFILPAFLIIFAGGCFSVVNAPLGAFVMVIVASIIAYLGWLPISGAVLVSALSLSFLMALTYARRRIVG